MAMARAVGALVLALRLRGAVSAPAAAAAQQTVLRVFLLAGQSNAEGQAEVATKNKTSPTGAYLNGTLAYQLSDPRTAAAFAPLWDAAAAAWAVLPDVYCWYNENGTQQGVNGSAIPSAPGQASFGRLTVGYGALGDANLIGPELGLGFGLRDAFPGEQLLIMKTAWGGKTLAGDFRPPTSVATPDPFCEGDCPNVVGHYYRVMVDDVHKMLAPGAIAAMFPDLAGLTPMLGGLAWFQGWNGAREGREAARGRGDARAADHRTPRSLSLPPRRRLRPQPDCRIRDEPRAPHPGCARRVWQPGAARIHCSGGLQRI